MKILVTGGLGFIGSHTVVELLENNYDVCIVMNVQGITRSAVNQGLSFGTINKDKKTPKLLAKDDDKTVKKERMLALIGSVAGVAIPLACYMKQQKVKNKANI